MGKGCCKLEAFPQTKTSIAAAQVSGVYPGVQTYQAYTLRYQEIQPISPTTTTSRGRVQEIRAKDTDLLYVCRRAPFSEAPMQKSPELLARHLETLAEIDHPHLCKLVECFWDSDHNEYLLVSERADKPCLLDWMEENDSEFFNGESDAADVVRQILSALTLAHSRGVAHGRLKFDCLLLTAPDGGEKRSPRSPRQDKSILKCKLRGVAVRTARGRLGRGRARPEAGCTGRDRRADADGTPRWRGYDTALAGFACARACG
jgi:serine/threonine protein kinase